MLALLEMIAAMLCLIVAAMGLLLLNFRRDDGTLPGMAANSGAALILAALIAAMIIWLIDGQIKRDFELSETQEIITDLHNSTKGY